MLGQDRESKIGFENMAKLVARRWRELGPEDLAPYQKLAQNDMERYRVEMNEVIKRHTAYIECMFFF